MALTAISGTTKANSHKTARQRSFTAKEALADTAVSLPPDALLSVECKLSGVNSEGAFGTNTIGQKIEGKLVLYAAHSAIRTFAHELVTKKIESVVLTTNSGITYTFATADATPALSFAYEDAQLVTADDKPTTITLLMTGFRDNAVMS